MRHRRTLLFIFLVLFIILFSTRTLISYYVDSLWFASLGYASIFWRTLSYQWICFGVAFVATFGVLYAWFSALRHGCREELASAGTLRFGNQSYELPVAPVLRIAGLLGSLLIALVAGAAFMNEWARFALYFTAPAGASDPRDPVLGKTVGFYLFTLPAVQFFVGWLMVITLVCCAVAGLFLLMTTSSQFIRERRYGSSPVPLRWFSGAIAFLLVVVAVRTFLGRFDRVIADHTIFDGVTYTDAHIILGGLLIICAALIIGAGIAGMNLFLRPRVALLVAAPVPAIACFILVQIAAWYVNSFIVKPNELVRERPYIAHNIEFTRQAFGLDRITQREFPAETTVEAADAAEQSGHPPEHPAVGLARAAGHAPAAPGDPHLLRFSRHRHRSLPDRRRERQVMLATRELNVEKLPESSRNWINEKLIYTHGYGVTMNPVNGFTPEGLPTLILQGHAGPEHGARRSR